ncbi:hypothetical protein cyc_04565 [Cyclospora cayetanensis]|uniref:Uncharacterized protein n=1 Tax=Cyclospora cayetanensis TaxID=88456 RepID=A0A1D3CUL4_9EIME|nr:hypothetical protein cyc_04565 [Cyclospora cayetanensis]
MATPRTAATPAIIHSPGAPCNSSSLSTPFSGEASQEGMDLSCPPNPLLQDALYSILVHLSLCLSAAQPLGPLAAAVVGVGMPSEARQTANENMPLSSHASDLSKALSCRRAVSLRVHARRGIPVPSAAISTFCLAAESQTAFVHKLFIADQDQIHYKIEAAADWPVGTSGAFTGVPATASGDPPPSSPPFHSEGGMPLVCAACQQKKRGENQPPSRNSHGASCIERGYKHVARVWPAQLLIYVSYPFCAEVWSSGASGKPPEDLRPFSMLYALIYLSSHTPSYHKKKLEERLSRLIYPKGVDVAIITHAATAAVRPHPTLPSLHPQKTTRGTKGHAAAFVRTPVAAVRQRLHSLLHSPLRQHRDPSLESYAQILPDHLEEELGSPDELVVYLVLGEALELPVGPLMRTRGCANDARQERFSSACSRDEGRRVRAKIAKAASLRRVFLRHIRPLLGA